MQNIRKNLVSTLLAGSIPLIDQVLDFGGEQLALDNIDSKVIFNDAAIVLGDSTQDMLDFTPTQERKEVEIEILVFLKTDRVRKNVDTIVLEICKLLHGNTLGLSSVIKSTAELFTQSPIEIEGNEDLNYIIVLERLIIIESTTTSDYLIDADGEYIFDEDQQLIEVA